MTFTSTLRSARTKAPAFVRDVPDPGAPPVLTSPDGTMYQLAVDDAGELSTEAATDVPPVWSFSFPKPRFRTSKALSLASRLDTARVVSANGTIFQLSVADGGALSAVAEFLSPAYAFDPPTFDTSQVPVLTTVPAPVVLASPDETHWQVLVTNGGVLSAGEYDGDVEPPVEADPPGAPTNVAASAGDAEADVTWDAPASNGGAEITGYTVTSSPGGLTEEVDGETLEVTVTGLTNDTEYTFTVVATNSAGDSPASSASNAVTPVSGTTVPGAPTGATAVAGDTQATVSFSAPASNGGASITGYTVTSSPGGLEGTGASSPITVTGLTNDTEYTFTVVATNSVGDSAPSSASNPVTPTAGVPGESPSGGTHLPDGDDTIGGTWPGPTSTGSSGTLTDHDFADTGAADQSFSDMRFTTDTGGDKLDWQGANATFVNCTFTRETNFVNVDGLVLTDCTFEKGFSLQSMHDVTITRVDSFGSEGDLLHLAADYRTNTDITVVDSYFHDPNPGVGAHSDGIQLRGSLRFEMQHTYIDLGDFVEEHNAAIYFETGNTDWIVNQCFLSGGHYSTYLTDADAGCEFTNNVVHLATGAAGGATFPSPSANITMSGNIERDGDPIAELTS